MTSEYPTPTPLPRVPPANRPVLRQLQPLDLGDDLDTLEGVVCDIDDPDCEVPGTLGADVGVAHEATD